MLKSVQTRLGFKGRLVIGIESLGCLSGGFLFGGLKSLVVWYM